MFRVGSWLYNKASPASVSTQSLDALAESQELQSALRAATFIINDDVDGAEEGLNKGDSSFHKLGKGIVSFVRATLGFEQEIMRLAGERLSEAETCASNDYQKAQHNSNAPNAYRSPIYAPGTEFLLCRSMAQLMAALVGVLNESLTESIKAFYKLRKAYIALDNIMQMEEKYLQEESARKMASSNISLPPNHSLAMPTKPLVNRSDTSKAPGITSDRASGSQLGNGKPDEPRLSNDATAFSSTEAEKSSSQPPEPPPSPTQHLDQDPDSNLFTNPVDAFVHSGANLCFGLLLLLISMVPPAFSKLLYIVGFRGDRRRGLRMLWQASKFHNLNGAIAGLGLLAYYNGFIRHCDIIDDCPSENEDRVDSYSEHRLTALLSVMRHRFPHSHLWLLEESRMQAAKKNLGAALELLSGDTKSPLKQVEALCVFEKSLTSMYLHKYELCAESFIECAELNSWSRALYYYIAASAHLAIYRQNALDSPTLAKEHAAKALELFQKVPSQAGKKKFMARQLPFDVFVTRKISKWESRAKEWNVDFIDAIGVDPLEEMIYLWNGHSRMNEEELQNSLRCLAWSESEQNKHWDRENEDEFAILALLRASIFRFLGRHEESKTLLRSKILVHDPVTFKGHLKDDWTCPTAHYEMAANLWMERYSYRPICSTAGGVPANGSQSQSESTSATETNHVPKSSMSISSKTSHESNENAEAHDRRKVRECREWIEKVAKWETYELDARVGLKVTVAEDTLQKWESANPR
ncbi:mitochondrial outer membrane protein iml2 [Histoplasma capsulatum H143]|uniref:Inclusion body clearance protein IML2 n=1 Tax=Ajellomyces capsulatus (strain H143) TaxID=544712 RepID=C6H9D0_AJECH|nr:mitochondrial outer membrane protein iml2 [Histoplasma capsulatum H143]